MLTASRNRIRFRIVLALLPMVMSFLACSTEPSSLAQGHALEQTNGLTWGIGAIAPGDGFHLLFGPLRNTSGRTIRVEEVQPVGLTGIPDRVVVRIHLAPRTGNEVRPVPQGRYVGYPPAWLRKQGEPCTVQSVMPVENYLLEPSKSPADRAILLTSVKALSDGPFSLEIFRVVYTSAGDRFVQEIPISIKGRVESGRPPQEPDRKEALCES